jgi:hypothetical protein
MVKEVLYFLIVVGGISVGACHYLTSKSWDFLEKSKVAEITKKELGYFIGSIVNGLTMYFMLMHYFVFRIPPLLFENW